MRESVDRLLKYNNDERLADLAKEKGKDLYSNLPLDDRSDKIHNMVSPYMLIYITVSGFEYSKIVTFNLTNSHFNYLKSIFQ